MGWLHHVVLPNPQFTSHPTFPIPTTNLFGVTLFLVLPCTDTPGVVPTILRVLLLPLALSMLTMLRFRGVMSVSGVPNVKVSGVPGVPALESSCL